MEALEQGALASVGGSEVGGEGSTSLLESGSGPLEVGLTLGVWWLRSAWRAGPHAGTLVVSVAGKVRGQGRTSVSPLWGAGLGRMRLSLSPAWCGDRAVEQATGKVPCREAEAVPAGWRGRVAGGG